MMRINQRAVLWWPRLSLVWVLSASPFAGLQAVESLRLTSSLFFAGKLLVQLPHFNYRSNIVYRIVRTLDWKSDKIVQISFDAVSDLFKNELRSEVSLECTKAIAEYAKSKNFNVREEVEVLKSFIFQSCDYFAGRSSNV